LTVSTDALRSGPLLHVRRFILGRWNDYKLARPHAMTMLVRDNES
jgi:hypothetical protein